MRVPADPDERVTARAGWEAYCTQTPAPKPEPQDRSALSEAAAAEYDRARRRYMAEVFVRHPAVQTIADAVLDALDTNEFNSGASVGVAVDGMPATGKTELVKRIARSHHNSRLAAAPPDVYDDLLPVVFTEIPTQRTVKSLAKNLCRAVGVPLGRYPNRLSLHDLEDALHETLKGLGTSLFVLDEIQRLGTTKTGQDAARFVKQLANDYPNVTIVYSGFDILGRGPFTGEDGEQLLGRCAVHRLRGLPYRSKDEKDEFHRVLRQWDKHVLLADHRQGDLVRLAPYLHARTEGRVGALSTLIRNGAARAIRRGEERLTDDLLNGIQVDLNTQKAAEAEVKQAQKEAAAERKQAARSSKGRAA